MFDAFAPWLGLLAIVVTLSKTGLSLAKLYYENKRQERLERLDRGLQIENTAQEVLVEELVNIAMTSAWPYQIGEKVVEKFERNKLIPKEKADYILIGAEKHRVKEI